MIDEKNHLLIILAEELCEAGQRVTKALRFGMEEIQPGKVATNRARLIGELNDVIAMLELTGLDKDPMLGDRISINNKKENVRLYMNHAREVGALK